MNIEELRQIAVNPAASAREREAALKRLAELQMHDQSDPVLLRLLSSTGAARLRDVSFEQMCSFAQAGDESVKRIEQIYFTLGRRETWTEYLGSTDDRRKGLGRLLSLLYTVENEDAALTQYAHDYVKDAGKLLQELGWNDRAG